ncbi:MAG TPA: helix-turn-helix domain-containing protein [Nocardioidaceae bacterium]|nr:helix-turn-helix domain-containing protein [Nocardioidaceae bacterium]
MSVPEVASRLHVSEARVRQRIDEGSLVAQKIGGRWLVDLGAPDEVARQARGRPVSPSSVWYSLQALDLASLIDLPDLSISDASRRRAVIRLASALENADHQAVLSWLRNRGERRLYVAAEADLVPVRNDDRVLPSGLSHPESQMSDPRVAEGYVAKADVDALAANYWLEKRSPDDKPNVVLHVVPALPSSVSRLLLAADLAEHGGPREAQRAHELIAEVAAEFEASR